MFALQSKYDEYQIGSILGSNNPPDVNDFGNELESLMQSKFLSSNPKHGVFFRWMCSSLWGVGDRTGWGL